MIEKNNFQRNIKSLESRFFFGVEMKNKKGVPPLPRFYFKTIIFRFTKVLLLSMVYILKCY